MAEKRPLIPGLPDWLGLPSLVLLAVVVLGLLLDMVWPERTRWWEFWKEPSKVGVTDSPNPTSEQASEDLPPQRTDYCWPWEWCFWQIEGPPAE